MKLQLFFCILIFFSGLRPDLEAGEIYQWIDKDGVQHFTNLPPPPGAQIVEGLSETPTDEPPAGTSPNNQKDKRATKGDKKNPAALGDTGTVEGDPGAVKSGDRRFRKWENGPTDRGDSGAVKDGEEGPADREDTGAVEDVKKGPADRRLY